MSFGGGYYPPGTPPPRVVRAEVECAECGRVREAEVELELGAATVLDRCPECGSEEWRAT